VVFLIRLLFLVFSLWTTAPYGSEREIKQW
jgi:hypothetical protein